MNREQFLALLARLRGEGDALTVADYQAIAAYMEASAGDRDALTDEEVAEAGLLICAAAADETVTLAELEAAVVAFEGVTATETARVEADEQVETQRQTLLARLAPPAPIVAEDPEPPAEDPPVADPPAEDPPADPEVEAPEAVEEPELVGAVAAAPRPRIRPGELRARRPAGAVAIADPPRTHNRIVRDGGGEYAGISELAVAMYEKRAAFLSANNGISEYLTLGSVVAEYPQDRILDPDNTASTVATLSRLKDDLWNKPEQELAALTASGGFCAPAEPYYGIAQLAGADRPFRGSLQQFNAGRGAITFRTPPDFPSFDAATGIWTNTNDTTPGSDGAAKKPCLTVVCNATQTATIYAVTECLTFGNFMARTDPETVQNAVLNTMAAFARKAEVKLIDAMKSASKAVTSGKAIGAYRDLSYDIRVAAAAYRSRHRMRRDAQLEARMPYWVPDLVLADLVRNIPGDGNVAAAEDIWNRALAAARVTVVGYYMDSPTGANRQVFGPQNTTGLVDFPETVQWQLSAPGSFLLLDNGRLDLGIVRDSTLNATNDYQTFAETFEGLAFIGIESLWVTSTVCASGMVAGTLDTSAFCSGDYVPA